MGEGARLEGGGVRVKVYKTHNFVDDFLGKAGVILELGHASQNRG